MEIASTEWFFTQGVLGVTTLLGILASLGLWRAREADRLRFEGTMQAKDAAHDVELAQWQKAVQDLQNERANDLRAQSQQMASQTELIRQLWQSTKGGAGLDKIA